jgi:hypothetical protein
MRFFVVGFFFVTKVPLAAAMVPIPPLPVMAAETLVDGTTMDIGIVIAEVPAEVVVVLAVIVADAAGQLSYQA